MAPVIYNCFPNVSPDEKIVQSPINLVYLPVIVDTINCIKVWFTDQNHNLLNFRGEVSAIRDGLKLCICANKSMNVKASCFQCFVLERKNYTCVIY